MSDYEVYEEQFVTSDKIEVSDIDYGTPDPNILPSHVPCGGCGAHLHCQVKNIISYSLKDSKLFLIYILCRVPLYLVISQKNYFCDARIKIYSHLYANGAHF